MGAWIRGDIVAVGAILVGLLARTGVDRMDAPAPETETPAAAAAQGQSSTGVPTGPAGSEAATGVAFYASSIEEYGAVTGDYGGRLHRMDGGLVAELRGVTLRFHPWDEEDLRSLTGVRLALAEATSEGWRIVRQGPPTALDLPVTPGQTRRIDALRVTLPDVVESELAGRWLVVVHELRGAGVEGPTSGATYAHADEGLLGRLMGWIEPVC